MHPARKASFLALALLGACSRSTIPAQRDGAPLDAVRVGLPASEAMPGAPDKDAKAAWAGNGDVARFGFPGQGPLLSVECRSGVLLVTRHIPAEIGAQALFALQGGGHILRLPVDATSVPGLRGYIWQGSLPANDQGAAVFGSAFRGTLPGGGMIEVSASDVVRQVVRRCGAHPAAAPAVIGGTGEPGAPE
ncbi:MAG: hypothetical protein RIS94_2501 [Pseudomonadota bacterium]|jgi:hypothetical protein